MDDAKRKATNMNKKMNEFARNLNGNLRSRNSTLYSEVRHVGNKELEDRQGLKSAYDRPTGLYKSRQDT